MTGLDRLSNSQLIALLEQALAANAQLQSRVVALEEQLQQGQQDNLALRAKRDAGNASKTPAWVKPNRPVAAKTARKKRQNNFARKRQEPTAVQVHGVEVCPDCGRTLSGGWVHRRRQVIEIPPTPATIVEHIVMARHCGVCGKRRLPTLDLSPEVVGQHRVGIRLMSLIADLHTLGRLPLRTVQKTLHALYGLRLSVGELSEVLHTVAQVGQPTYQALQQSVRTSDFIHADETGWRENGHNGYFWSFSRPGLRYFTFDAGRSHFVPERVLGADYAGILVSDFYSGYFFHLGLHQRCWVHFLRDLHALKDAHPSEPDVGAWVARIRRVYDAAKSFAGDNKQQRVRARERFQAQLATLAQPYARRDCPQRVLAQRIERFLPELFTFVEHPQVPSENNAAERSIRPLVIARKVSGGTRSAKGSQTRAVLASLFGTWQAQGKEGLEACRQMLTGWREPASAMA